MQTICKLKLSSASDMERPVDISDHQQVMVQPPIYRLSDEILTLCPFLQFPSKHVYVQ